MVTQIIDAATGKRSCVCCFSWEIFLRTYLPDYTDSPTEFQRLRQVCSTLKFDTDTTTHALWGGRFGSVRSCPGIPLKIAEKVELLIPKVNFIPSEELKGTPFSPRAPTSTKPSEFVGRGKRSGAVPFSVHHNNENWNLTEPFIAGSYALYQVLQSNPDTVHDRLRETVVGRSWYCWRPGDIDIWFPGRPTIDWLSVVMHWRLRRTFPFLTFTFGTVEYGDPALVKKNENAFIRDFAEIVAVDGAGCEKIRINLIAICGKEPTIPNVLNTFDFEICRVGFKPRANTTLPPATLITGKGFWRALAQAEGYQYLQHEDHERARARREKYENRGYHVIGIRCRSCGAKQDQAEERSEYKQNYSSAVTCLSRNFVCSICTAPYAS